MRVHDRLGHLTILALLIGLTGCTTTSVYTPEHLSREDERTVTLHLKDGALIRLSPGDYEVTGTAQDSVRGVGERVTNTLNNAATKWEGNLALADIDSVSVTQLNLLGNAAWLGAALLGIYTLTHVGPYGWH